ncbi:hypothetical protein GCM10009118_07650 [Wandonia haliotis]|uniref:Uncharacterized protein n=2 Tax=Wandonia haliotis TaxID=574963 RepID=A0ABP3Y0T6_9FLAO
MFGQCNNLPSELLNLSEKSLRLIDNAYHQDTIYFLIPKEMRADIEKEFCFFYYNKKVIAFAYMKSYFGSSVVEYWYEFSEINKSKGRVTARLNRQYHSRVKIQRDNDIGVIR